MPAIDPNVVDVVAGLMQQGHTERLLLSHDICWRSRMKHWGGSGFDYLVTYFLPRLRKKGVDDEAIHTITVENPARVLAV